MLGNLFDDSGDISSGAGVLERSRIESGPPSVRSETNLAGIANQGATCYLNSLLQTLLFTSEFRESLFQISEAELGSLEDKDKTGSKVRVIPLQLQRLFARLLLLNQSSISTEELTESFGWTNNEQFQQHDVQELNRILFSAVETSLTGTSGHQLIQELYHGNIVNRISCLECGKISETEEDFLDLTLSVSDVDSLEKTLACCYSDVELLNGKNQYRCERCQKLVDAQKGAKIRTLPRILTISLLRFSFDFQKMKRFKDTEKFTFPMELDMSPYVDTPSENLLYELFSVVIHRGGAYGGHYHAFIRDIDNFGHWSTPVNNDIKIITKSKKSDDDDDMVKATSPGDVIKLILQREPNHSMAIDKLGSAIRAETGVTWAKRFKKNHGTLSKFVSSCAGLVFDNDNRSVSLPTEDESLPEVSSELSGHGDADALEHKQESKLRSPDSPAEGHCWFNFDDSRVSPVRSKDIEKYFSGRESAYMMFYRRKLVDVPCEANSNPAINIADKLLSEVLTENNVLEVQREEYSLMMNSISVLLHYETNFCYHHGALKVKHHGICCTELTIDRRKTVQELKEAVYELGDRNVSLTEMTLHRMKDLVAGLHLYNCLSDDPDKAIESLTLCQNVKIFVWDGQKVDGNSIPIGEESEPIYLTILYDNQSQFSSGYQKNISMADFRVSLSDLTGINCSHLKIKKMVGSQNETYYKTFLKQDNNESLAKLGFCDGDQIIIEDKNNKDRLSNVSCVKDLLASKDNFYQIIIENRCNGYDEPFQWQTKCLQVSDDMMVSEVKVMAISAFEEITLIEGSRLRVDDPTIGMRPPLHEQQTLAAASIFKGVCLVLERGKAPDTDQITLTYTPLDMKSDSPDLEVTVSKSMTVKECVQEMACTAGLDGDNLHVCKTNWCGEPAEILDDVELSLDKSLVHNGDHLLLLAGKLPPKGFLRLPIYLYPSPNKPCTETTGMIGWVTSGLQDLLSGNHSTSIAGDELPALVGEVEISKDAALVDLKLQIMNLVTDRRVPTHDFLRVRLIEEQRPGAVLRSNDLALRRQKVKSGCQIAIQILHQEEKLSPHEMVLGIKQRLSGTLTYAPEMEFIWNMSIGLSPRSLLSSIADFLALPEDQINVGKHFPRQFRWQIVEEKTSVRPDASQKGKKHKNKVGKSNMKHAPYHLSDGDVLGVKTLLGDPDNLDNFCTDEDRIGREELQREVEEKRKMREARKRDYGEGQKSRQKEVALTIKVDTFT